MIVLGGRRELDRARCLTMRTRGGADDRIVTHLPSSRPFSHIYFGGSCDQPKSSGELAEYRIKVWIDR